MDTGGQSYFMFCLRYAFRNLWRNSRRTTLTIGTVLFSVSVAIIANRYSTAIMQLWQDAAADTGSAHAQLHAKGFWAQPEGVNRELTIEQDTPYEQSIRNDPGVEASVRRLRLEDADERLADALALRLRVRHLDELAEEALDGVDVQELHLHLAAEGADDALRLLRPQLHAMPV
mgnify:CR=1 FL=1